MKAKVGRAIAAFRAGPLLALAAPVAVCVPAFAADLFEKFPHIQHPVVANQETTEAATEDASPAEGVTHSTTHYDLAQFFPNLKMPPILAATPAGDEGNAGERSVVHSDFAAIVAQAKREALVAARTGSGSIAAGMPDGESRRGTPANLASLSRPHCRQQCRPQPACPPKTGSPTVPQQPRTDVPRPSAPGLPAVPPSDTGMPVVPLPDIPRENLAVPALPVVPDLRQDLPSTRSLAQADVGGGRTNWSDAPNIVGDGCAPTGSLGQISVGRICIVAEGLSGSPLHSTGSPATLNVLTQGQFNNVQAIKNAGYPVFTLPAQPLGQVAGTPPTSLTAGQPSGGIIPVNSPSTFLASANNTFATNPSLNTSNYSQLNPTTVYDAASSGALPNPVPSGTPATYDAFMFYNYVVDSNIVLPGYAVGFVKLTENQSPIPRDRVYMTYSYFSNANFYPTKADVNRFMPGFEKTFFDGWSSVEIRTPFAATLSNGQTLAPGGQGVSEYRDAQFGNMSVIFKTFIWEQQTWALTGGIQVMLPTANNTYLNGVNALNQPVQQVFVANESVHLMPFIGGIWAPNERFFNQFLIQYEKDANGNLAYVNNNFQTGITGRQLQQAGRIFYPDFLYLSFGTGYWLYKDNTQNFTGFAPVMEIHVNQGLSAYCPIEQAGYQLGPNLGVVSVTNALVGCNFEWGERSTLTFGYVTPLGGGVDRFFDGELRALYNWRFGPQNRLTRAQF
jgi:hypothetical protein